MLKWRKDPGKFYVDNDAYPRAEQYGTFCATTVDEMHHRSPNTLSGATEWCAPRVKAFYAQLSGKTGYGDVRPIEIMEPTLKHQHQQEVIQLTLKRLYGGNLPDRDMAVYATLTGPDGKAMELPVTLIKPVTHAGENFIELHHFHSPQEECTADKQGDYYAELLWQKASQHYREAKTGQTGKELLSMEQRQDAAKRCYWCFSHYMPMKYGSATTGAIILDYLADQVGMHIGKPKKDVDMNIEALLKSEDRFVREFDDMFRRPPVAAHSTPALH